MKENESEIRNPNKYNGFNKSILRSIYSSSTNPGIPGNEQATGYTPPLPPLCTVGAKIIYNYLFNPALRGGHNDVIMTFFFTLPS